MNTQLGKQKTSYGNITYRRRSGYKKQTIYFDITYKNLPNGIKRFRGSCHTADLDRAKKETPIVVEHEYEKRKGEGVADGNKPIDMLFCVPPTWVEHSSDGALKSRVSRQYEDWGFQTWDAVDPELRGDYPTSVEQYRIVQYESCRGLEGWVVVNFALDEFYEYKLKNAEISATEKSDIFYEQGQAAKDYAKKWIMIPLTRAIDTLVIHVSDKNSYIGQVLLKLRDKYPENIEYLEL